MSIKSNAWIVFKLLWTRKKFSGHAKKNVHHRLKIFSSFFDEKISGQLKHEGSNLHSMRYNKKYFISISDEKFLSFVSSVKMEYGWNLSISGQKMTVKSGLEKIFLKFLHALTIFYKWIYLIERRSFGQKYKFSNKNDMVSAWRNFKNIFSRPLFTIIFRPEMLFTHIPFWPGTQWSDLSYSVC